MDVGQSTLEDANKRVQKLQTCLAGSSHPQWWKDFQIEDVEYIIRGDTVNTRLKCLLDWTLHIFGLEDKTKTSRLFEDKDFELESFEIFKKFWDFRFDIVRRITNVSDTIEDIAERERIKNKLFENETRLAFSFDVLWHAFKTVHHISTLNHLLPKEGGNIYDISIQSEWTSRNSKYQKLYKMLNNQEEEEEVERKKKDTTCIIDHLMKIAYKKKYRKRNGLVYEEKVVVFENCRYGSRYWEPAKWPGQRGNDASESSMKNFLQYYCSKDLFPEISILLTDNTGKIKGVIDQLNDCKTNDFKEVQPQQNLISFRNGIFNTTAAAIGVFNQYGTSTEEYASVATANYIDQDFPVNWFLETGCMGGAEWQRIPTPAFQYSYIKQTYLH